MKTLFVFFLGLVGIPSLSSAESCTAFLPKDNEIISLELVTMNKNAAASYVKSEMRYGRGNPDLGHPPRVTTIGTAPQVFSDRNNKFFASPIQYFDAMSPDNVTVEITLEESPQVTLTLASWGNAKATFRATCSGGGVMHGSTPDVDYLLFVKRQPLGL
jgi:hypothetical protein